MCLSQLVANGIRCVIAFELFCNERGVRSIIGLFHSFFLNQELPILGMVLHFSSSWSLGLGAQSDFILKERVLLFLSFFGDIALCILKY